LVTACGGLFHYLKENLQICLDDWSLVKSLANLKKKLPSNIFSCTIANRLSKSMYRSKENVYTNKNWHKDIQLKILWNYIVIYIWLISLFKKLFVIFVTRYDLCCFLISCKSLVNIFFLFKYNLLFLNFSFIKTLVWYYLSISILHGKMPLWHSPSIYILFF
jgi:hypothetical protein